MGGGKRYGAEGIIGKPRGAEVGLAQGQTVAQVVRTLGISEETYYRWRREYGGMKVDQAKRPVRDSYSAPRSRPPHRGTPLLPFTSRGHADNG